MEDFQPHSDNELMNIEFPQDNIDQFKQMIEKLANNPEVLCKSQQRDELDISITQKTKMLMDIFNKNKANFLSRFGKFLESDEIDLFQQFEEDVKDGYEIKFHLKNITQNQSKIKKHLRNRRYAALKRLVEKGAYFSETEMMKRNPLLYDQLVGQYLSPKEKRLRDRSNYEKVNSFVSVLMSAIEKEHADEKRKMQEEAEWTNMLSDSSSSDSEEESCEPSKAIMKNEEKPVRSLWGEFREEGQIPRKPKPTTKDVDILITSQERQLLREEFLSTMYENFLDGKDDDFDYNAVDNNDEYDNLEIIANDEEEKYFDSEEPDDMNVVEEETGNVRDDSSEDDLDIYMNALNQHPAVCQLSEDIKKL